MVSYVFLSVHIGLTEMLWAGLKILEPSFVNNKLEIYIQLESYKFLYMDQIFSELTQCVTTYSKTHK
jgi:hypothetical protein